MPFETDLGDCLTFVEAEFKTKGIFWRRHVEIDKCCETLRNLEPLDAFIALLTIIKEAESIQDQDAHYYAFDEMIQYKKKLKGYAELKFTLKPLFEYFATKWKLSGYFD